MESLKNKRLFLLDMDGTIYPDKPYKKVYSAEGVNDIFVMEWKTTRSTQRK